MLQTKFLGQGLNPHRRKENKLTRERSKSITANSTHTGKTEEKKKKKDCAVSYKGIEASVSI